MSNLSNFSRIRSSNPPAGEECQVWVMLAGTKRQCSGGTQAELFIDDAGIDTIDDQGIAEDDGVHDAYIARDEVSGRTYVVTLGNKHHIDGDAVSDRLRLRIAAAKPLTPEEAAAIPDGPDIT